jgi:hypothetical protein
MLQMALIKRRARGCFLAPWVLALLGLLGRGGSVMAASSSEEALRTRAEQCFTAFQQGDWAKVEKYLTKDSRRTFHNEAKHPLPAYRIKSIKLEPDGQTATVVVEVPLISAAMPRPIPVANTTLWRLQNRVWCLELSGAQPNATSRQDLFSMMAAKPMPPPHPLPTSTDLKFESNWCGLGNVQSGDILVAKFPFKNVSTHSVTLVGIQLGCDCLRLKTQQKEFKPGESATLEIEFNPASLQLPMEESFTQTIVLTTEPGGQYLLLTIGARVAPAPKPAAKP